MASPGSLLPLLFIVASCLHCGEAFRCFSCEEPTLISSCINITHCQPQHTACRTTVVMGRSEYPFNQSPLVTKSCSSSCLANDPDSIGDSSLIYCCFRDLCNSVGTSSLHAGTLIIILGVTLLGHFFS